MAESLLIKVGGSGMELQCWKSLNELTRHFAWKSSLVFSSELTNGEF